MDITTGMDPYLGGATATTGLLVKLVLFPAIGLRRKGLTDVGDERTGDYYIPRALHSGIVFGVVVLCALAASYLMQKPPIFVVSSALTGCALAVAAHDTMKDRS